MKILLTNNLYKPYSRGGADRIVEIMHDGLKSLGHEVFVVSTAGDRSAYREGNNFYLKSFFSRLGRAGKFVRALCVISDLFNIKNYFLIKKIIKQEKINLAITHNLRGLGFLSIWAFKKIKHVHVLHDIQLIHPLGLVLVNEEGKLNGLAVKFYFNLTKFIFASPQYIISPSRWLLDEHVKRGFFKKSKKQVIPNPAVIAENDFQDRDASDAVKFLYVGEIEKHKGVLLLVKAFAQCQKYYENISLDIVGKGSCQEELPQTTGINYLGWKMKNEVVKVMENSDCLIMPSLCYENSPTVLYEAAAVGLPVISSRIGGATELVHYLGGLLFCAGDEKDLEKKIIFAIKNPRIMKNIGDSSREKIKKYSLENYLKIIAKIIEEN